MDDPYEILMVNRNATKEEVKKAYHELSLKFHPDRIGGDQEEFKRISSAYEKIVKNIEEVKVLRQQFNFAIPITSILTGGFHDLPFNLNRPCKCPPLSLILCPICNGFPIPCHVCQGKRTLSMHKECGGKGYFDFTVSKRVYLEPGEMEHVIDTSDITGIRSEVFVIFSSKSLDNLAIIKDGNKKNLFYYPEWNVRLAVDGGETSIKLPHFERPIKIYIPPLSSLESELLVPSKGVPVFNNGKSTNFCHDLYIKPKWRIESTNNKVVEPSHDCIIAKEIS